MEENKFLKISGSHSSLSNAQILNPMWDQNLHQLTLHLQIESP